MIVLLLKKFTANRYIVPQNYGESCKIGEEILYINIDLSITRCRIWTKTSMNEIIIGKTVRDYGKGENYQQT